MDGNPRPIWDDKMKDEGKFIVLESTDKDKKLTDIGIKILGIFINKHVKKYRSMSKLGNGVILIRTLNKTDAVNALGEHSLGLPQDDIKVKISLHKTLNYVEGSIYSKALLKEPEQDIAEALKPYNVVKVHRIQKRIGPDTFEPTPILILTFMQATVPEKVHILHHVLSVKPNYPRPMRCRKCQRYNHTDKFCKAEVAICNICGQNLPHGEGVQCSPNCINCANDTSLKDLPHNHAAGSKDCPYEAREFEIRKIQIQKKTGYVAAKLEFEQRLKSSQGPTVASVLKDALHEDIKALREEMKSLKDMLIQKDQEIKHLKLFINSSGLNVPKLSSGPSTSKETAVPDITITDEQNKKRKKANKKSKAKRKKELLQNGNTQEADTLESSDSEDNDKLNNPTKMEVEASQGSATKLILEDQFKDLPADIATKLNVLRSQVGARLASYYYDQGKGEVFYELLDENL